MKAKGKTAAKKRYDGFSSEERAAMRDRVKEQKTAGRAGADPEEEVLAKIAAMETADRVMAQRIHAVVRAAAPELTPKLWYGMPAYARDGKLICFFQPATKFKTRYATLGFSDSANLDDGSIWPNAYAVMKVTPVEEAKIRALVKQALA